MSQVARSTQWPILVTICEALNVTARVALGITSCEARRSLHTIAGVSHVV